MSIYTNWDPLEEIIVGNCHTEIPLNWKIDKRARPLINQILRETKEDLDNLENILVGLGVKVHRPIPNLFPENIELPSFNVLNATNPIVPRDQYLAYGETIYQTYTSMPDRYFDSYNYYEIFKSMFDQGYNWISQPPPLISNFKGKKWFVDGPSIYGQDYKNKVLWHTATMYKCGDALITNNAGPGSQAGLEWMVRNLDANIIYNNDTIVNNWGHIDHGFYMIDDETVVCMNQTWIPQCLRNKKIIDLAGKFQKFPYQDFLKQTSMIKDKNHTSVEWLNVWLQEWKGYSQDVAFETNVLVVDSKNIICSAVQPKVFELFDKIGITCHLSTIRHGLFWEAGIHCLTLDLKRRGQKRSIISTN